MGPLDGFIDATPVLQGGVYALVYRGEVIYIGKAKRMLNRLTSHLSVWAAKRKERVPSWLPVRGIYYDAVYIRPTHPDQIDRVEQELIDLYRPKHNVQHKLSGPTKAPFSIKIGETTLPFNQRQAPTEIIRRL